MDWGSMITVGRIIRPHHNKGHVVVMPETDFPRERFEVGSVLYRERDGRVEPIVVSANREREGQLGRRVRRHREHQRCRDAAGPGSAGAGHRGEAAGRGRVLRLRSGGLQVRTVGGQDVGPVGRVDLTTGVAMLVIEGDGEVLVPFTQAICRADEYPRRG